MRRHKVDIAKTIRVHLCCGNRDTLKLLPEAVVPADYRASVHQMPANRSFMHLHLGFDASGAAVVVHRSQALTMSASIEVTH